MRILFFILSCGFLHACEDYWQTLGWLEAQARGFRFAYEQSLAQGAREAMEHFPIEAPAEKKSKKRKRTNNEDGLVPEGLPTAAQVEENSFLHRLLEFNLPERIVEKQEVLRELQQQMVLTLKENAGLLEGVTEEDKSIITALLLDQAILSLSPFDLTPIVERLRKKRARKSLSSKLPATITTAGELKKVLQRFAAINPEEAARDTGVLLKTYDDMCHDFAGNASQIDLEVGATIYSKFILSQERRYWQNQAKEQESLEQKLEQAQTEAAAHKAAFFALDSHLGEEAKKLETFRQQRLYRRNHFEVVREMKKYSKGKDALAKRVGMLEAALRSEVQPQECFACLERKAPSVFITDKGVKKGFCADCSKRVVEEALHENPKTFGVVPEGNGQVEVSPEDLVAVGIDPLRAKRWKILSEGGGECLTKGCGLGAYVPNKDGVGTCDICKKESCKSCETQHPSMSCSQYQATRNPTQSTWMYWAYPPARFVGLKDSRKKERVHESWTSYSKRFFRACPNCSARVQHISDCYNMTCSKCNSQFHYFYLKCDWGVDAPDTHSNAANRFKVIKSVSSFYKGKRKTLPYTTVSMPTLDLWREKALEYLREHPEEKEAWERNQYRGYARWLQEKKLKPIPSLEKYVQSSEIKSAKAPKKGARGAADVDTKESELLNRLIPLTA